VPGIILAGQRLTASQLTTTVSNLATGSINNSTTESVVGSYAVPVSTVNQGFEYHAEGTNDNSGVSVTVTFRVRIGTTGTTADQLIITYGAITTQALLSTGLPWTMLGWMRVITGGSSGSVIMNDSLVSAIASSTSAEQPGVTPVTTTVNWTVSNFMTITAQWSGAASVSNVTRTIGGSLAALN
jgi:hypothetical protein